MSLWAALCSRRTAAVALQSFASGLPLGLVWYAIPDWMRDIGVDIQVVGLLTLAQAPWTFKVLWAPLVDRFTPPFWGRRRGWMALTQVALVALGLLMAGVGERPEAVWVVGALALAIAVAPPRRTSRSTPTPSKCCARRNRGRRRVRERRSIARRCS